MEKELDKKIAEIIENIESCKKRIEYCFTKKSIVSGLMYDEYQNELKRFNKAVEMKDLEELDDIEFNLVNTLLICNFALMGEE